MFLATGLFFPFFIKFQFFFFFFFLGPALMGIVGVEACCCSMCFQIVL